MIIASLEIQTHALHQMQQRIDGQLRHTRTPEILAGAGVNPDGLIALCLEPVHTTARADIHPDFDPTATVMETHVLAGTLTADTYWGVHIGTLGTKGFVEADPLHNLKPDEATLEALTIGVAMLRRLRLGYAPRRITKNLLRATHSGEY